MKLAELKQQGYIWQWQSGLDSASAPQSMPHWPSGYPELDQLTGGGWPQHQVTELRSPVGIGEFRLLQPYLQQQSQQQRLQVYINAPAPLYAPFLQAAGLLLSQQLEIGAKDADALWAAEQCLKSGCCSSVLLWQPHLSIAQLKRLQLAAAQGQAELFLFRPPQQYPLSLPVALSLQLQPAELGLQARLLKRRGGWPGGQQQINFSQRWPRLLNQRPLQAGTSTSTSGMMTGRGAGSASAAVFATVPAVCSETFAADLADALVERKQAQG